MQLLIVVVLIFGQIARFDAKHLCSVTVVSRQLLGKSTTGPSGQVICEYTNIPYAWKPKRFEQATLRDFESVTKTQFKRAPKKCIQRNYDYVSGSENCLYLNVYTLLVNGHGNGTDERRSQSVFVYLHGGTFNMGSPAEDLPDVRDFVEKDIVVVTINYRLGVFGFASFPAAAEPADLNLGLKDQQIALEWIQKYIDIFNGNPLEITLAGWSAGAAAVTYHLYSPQSTGLFSKAIVISGTFLNPWAFNLHSYRCTANLCRHLALKNCTKSELQKPRAENLIPDFASNLHFHHFGIKFSCFLPTIENGENAMFLGKRPDELIATAPINDVPILMGYTSLEESCDVEHDNGFSMEHYPFPVNTTCVDQFFENITSFLATHENPESFRQLRRIADTIYGTIEFAEAYAKRSVNAVIYLYRFSLPVSKKWRLCSWNENGALHGDDIKFMLRSELSCGDEKLLTIRKDMLRFWTDFIKFGDPTATNESNLATTWPQYNGESNGTFLNIGWKLSWRKRSVSKMYLLWDAFQRCIRLYQCNNLLNQLRSYYRN